MEGEKSGLSGFRFKRDLDLTGIKVKRKKECYQAFQDIQFGDIKLRAQRRGTGLVI